MAFLQNDPGILLRFSPSPHDPDSPQVISGQALRVKCRLPSFSSERQALESLFADIEALVKARTEFLQRPVEMPESGLSSENVRKAIARGAATGKPFSPLALGKRGTKTLVAAIKVSGRAPANADDWKHITRYLELHEQIASFLVRWNNFSDTLSMPRLEGGVNALRQIEIVALTATKAHRLATDFDVNLTKFAEAVFDHVPAKELMGSTADLEKVRQQLSQHLMRAELAKAVLDLAILQEKLAGKTGPISEELRVFVEEKLGKPEISVEQIVSLYSQITAELRRLAGLAVPLGWVSEACSRIEVAGAPRFAARLRSVAVASAGEDSAFPPNWRDAWNWARMRSHLDNIEAREELRALAQQRRELELGLARLYQELVAKAAWLATKRNATPKVLQALAGYATAIRRIGQGTGPNAMRYRRDARDAMKDAAGAVPCWIMSHARISEAMPPDIGAFDLVIVDEASQSDLWAMPAILRGKKILVVGDDKQVSPDSGFISSQRIGELKDRFLSDQPYGVEMTPEKSLYDLSARVFAAHQIMLREHFRCVPPIIAYSNRQFYERGIRPLRIPTTSERLDPPLIDIYVPDGHRDNRDCNRMEAEVIAEEIVAICANPQFAGRSIGVVSLLGMDQAKLIDETVLRRVDAAELMRRDFLSGDARTFQGSERDIMFLSMVVSPDACKALSGNIFDQRFNVAASRARDRMYLVRSVAASHLSSKDLRLSLLSHFDKPIVVDENEAENLRGRCESEFERAVFDALNERGYRVIPQVKTGAYRIDMVVEGTGDARLAIECDGDPFHGPDRWPQDMQRQRVLERAGWTFWRCFASTWTLHREEVLRELLEKLMAMGIEPVGAVTVMPSLVEKRVWKYATENEKIDSAINDVTSKALETNASINTMVSIQSSCAS